MASLGHGKTGSIHVAGIERSGKTTLSAFLDAHPSIAIPPAGTNMWTFFANRFGRLDNPENLQACLDAMMSYDRIRWLKPDLEWVERQFTSGPATYGHLFSLFLIQYSERRSKRIWGTQAGGLEKHASELVREYPDTRIIHIIRDPRDRYAAVRSHWSAGRGQAGAAAAKWNQSVALAKRNLSRYEGRYLVVQFEDLVLSPEGSLRQVCSFLGEEYAPEMLQAVKRRYDGEGATSQPLGDTLSSDYLGTFRDELSLPEWAFIQVQTRRGRRDFGYESSPLQLSKLERARFVVSVWPEQILRGAAWRLRDAFRVAAPAKYGRAIDDKSRVIDDVPRR